MVLYSAMLLARENTFGDQNKSNQSAYFVYFKKLFIKIKPTSCKISNNLTLAAYYAFKQTKISCNWCHLRLYPIRLTAFGISRAFSVTSETRELRQITYSPNRTQTQLKMKTNGPKWNSLVNNDRNCAITKLYVVFRNHN